MTNEQPVSPRCAPAFPQDLDSSPSRPTAACVYSWRDLERATAMIANLLRVAGPAGGRAHRGAGREVGRGDDALPGDAARRLCLPAAQHRLPERRDRILHRQRRAGRGGLHAARTSAGSARSPSRPARGTSSRSTTTARGSLLERAAHHSDTHEVAHAQRGRPRRDPLHQRHHRAQQGRDAHPRQPAVERARAEGLLGLAAERRRADPRAADLPCARPVRRARTARCSTAAR